MYGSEGAGRDPRVQRVSPKRSSLNLPLLERVTIALLAVLSVAALVAIIKYDMQRTPAPQPATRAGMNSTPIRCPQPRRLSGGAAPITPTLAVGLLGRV